MNIKVKIISVSDIKKARHAFYEHEPRDLFYRVAIELVDLALNKKILFSVAEAVAVLLQTWNKAYYQYYEKFNNRHLENIERLIEKHYKNLICFRKRSIDGFLEGDRIEVENIFKDFELVLGPVGAAKSLHILAPRFFPIWDRTIAYKYGFYLQERGKNSKKYCDFIGIAKKQYEYLKNELREDENPLKAIDEYNYCKYTKEWI